ncbi:MAG: triose-phosphate isomerase [Planctomycetota bacterium]|nr:triose-phosphate isomerase [Planctomycetota bacterium]
MDRPTIIAGNWKHNPDRNLGESLWREVLAGTMARIPAAGQNPAVQVVIFPPMPWLGWLDSQDGLRGLDREILQSGVFEIGMQQVSDRPAGAFTGEVGAEIGYQFGARWALVGHSERRTLFGETDETVAKRVAAAADHGMRPMLCIGETLEERDEGTTFEVVSRQLKAGLSRLDRHQEFAIAYEPVWAIGTGRTATVEQIEQVHRHLRELLQKGGGERSAGTPILYGGSVKPDNARDLLGLDVVDGALVGGASLDAASFLEILDAGIATA